MRHSSYSWKVHNQEKGDLHFFFECNKHIIPPII